MPLLFYLTFRHEYQVHKYPIEYQVVWYYQVGTGTMYPMVPRYHHTYHGTLVPKAFTPSARQSVCGLYPPVSFGGEIRSPFENPSCLPTPPFLAHRLMTLHCGAAPTVAPKIPTVAPKIPAVAPTVGATIPTIPATSTSLRPGVRVRGLHGEPCGLGGDGCPPRCCSGRR